MTHHVFQDLFPFLHREPASSCHSEARRDILLERFERLLLWHFGGEKDRREVRLFEELKKMADDILATDLIRDMCDPLVNSIYLVSSFVEIMKHLCLCLKLF